MISLLRLQLWWLMIVDGNRKGSWWAALRLFKEEGLAFAGFAVVGLQDMVVRAGVAPFPEGWIGGQCGIWYFLESEAEAHLDDCFALGYAEYLCVGEFGAAYLHYCCLDACGYALSSIFWSDYHA